MFQKPLAYSFSEPRWQISPLSNKYWGCLFWFLTAASDHRRAGIEAGSHFPPSFKAPAPMAKVTSREFPRTRTFPSLQFFVSVPWENQILKISFMHKGNLKVICLGKGIGLERSENNLNGCLKLFIFNT